MTLIFMGYLHSMAKVINHAHHTTEMWLTYFRIESKACVWSKWCLTTTSIHTFEWPVNFLFNKQYYFRASKLVSRSTWEHCTRLLPSLLYLLSRLEFNIKQDPIKILFKIKASSNSSGRQIILVFISEL